MNATDVRLKTWTPAVPRKIPDNIVSSSYATTKAFVPSYEKKDGRPCIAQLLANDYQRLWWQEKQVWDRTTTARKTVIKKILPRMMIKRKVPTCVTVKYPTRAERWKGRRKEDSKKGSPPNAKIKKETPFAKENDDTKLKEHEETKLHKKHARTKSGKYEETKSEKPEETEGEKYEETKSEKPEETEGEKYEETKSEKPEETEGEKYEETKSEKSEKTRLEGQKETEEEKYEEIKSEKNEEIKVEKFDETNKSEEREKTQLENNEDTKSEDVIK